MSQKIAEELLTPYNHELMKLVKARVCTPMSMTAIAAELGVHVDELCHWIMSVYREPPKRQKAYNTRHMPAIGFSEQETAKWSATDNARRFTAWKRARDGAAETRRMLEATGQ